MKTEYAALEIEISSKKNNISYVSRITQSIETKRLQEIDAFIRQLLSTNPKYSLIKNTYLAQLKVKYGPTLDKLQLHRDWTGIITF